MTTRKRPKKGRYNFLIDEEIYSEFSKICEEEGLVRSKQIEKSMKKIILERKGKEKTEK